MRKLLVLLATALTLAAAGAAHAQTTTMQHGNDADFCLDQPHGACTTTTAKTTTSKPSTPGPTTTKSPAVRVTPKFTG